MKCKKCGKFFIPTGHNQKYCSVKCRNASRHREKRVYPKVCAWCGKEFLAVHFNEKYCSEECKKARQAQYSHEHYMANHDHYLKQHRAWKEANKEKCRTYNRQWKKDNPDKVREENIRQYWKNRDERIARVKQWRKDNPEKARASKESWKKRNPEKVVLYAQRSKARKYAKRHNISEHYCITHNDCLNCPYPFDVCLFE